MSCSAVSSISTFIFFRIRKNRGFYFEAGVRSIAISVSVRSHISKTTCSNFTKFRGDIWQWRNDIVKQGGALWWIRWTFKIFFCNTTQTAILPTPRAKWFVMWKRRLPQNQNWKLLLKYFSPRDSMPARYMLSLYVCVRPSVRPSVTSGPVSYRHDLTA